MVREYINKNRYKKKSFWISAFFVFIALSFCIGNITASAANDNHEQRRKVRVGYYIAPGFQEYNETTGVYSGSSYEYLVALRQYTNWDYEFIPVNFAQGVKMLENGELDLMNNVSKTDEREQVLGFSSYASGANSACLVVDKNDKKYAYNDYETFSQMRVGMLHNSIFRSYFEDFCKENNIYPQEFYYDNDIEMSEALAKGEIDTRLVSSSYRDGSRVVTQFAPMNYYFAVPKSDATLLAELNKAMKSIQTDIPDFAQNNLAKYEIKSIEETAVLSAAEKEYISEHKEITVATSGAWYPILYYDKDSEICGPLWEIYKKIEDATGVKFKIEKYDSYMESLKAVKNGEVDTIIEFPYDFVYANEWDVQLSNKIKGIDCYSVINENNTSNEIHKIALHGEPYLEGRIKEKYADSVEYIFFDTVEEAIDSVLKGKTDCTFVNYYTSSKFQNKGKYISLKFILIQSLQYNFGIGISNSADPRLKSIIGKGLKTIDSDIVENLFQQSTFIDDKMDFKSLFYQNSVLFIILFCGLAMLFVSLVAIFFYSKRMKKKNTELERARNAQMTFLSRMSHDMRTPMNGILGLAALSDDEDNMIVMHENMKKIKDSGDYLLGLINDTLDFQRIESGKMKLEKQIIDTRQILNGILDIIKPAAEKKNIDFQIINDNAELDWYINIDVIRFKQILINLLSNAVKFTQEGGRIEFSFGCLGREGMISHDYIKISDNGLGMSEEFVKYKLFKPFSQESNEVSGQYAGSGLGLSIVKSLVELMNGKIGVESEKGKGTTFTIYLDFDRVEKKSAEKAIKKQTSIIINQADRLKGKNILLVEDHPLNAEIAQRILAKAGCNTTWECNGKLGVEAFKKSKPYQIDAILMDIRMPIMNGLEAAMAIRAIKREDAKTIPIIAMTANAYEEDVKQALEAGMNAHLAKPIKPQVLYESLSKYF